MQSRRKNCTKNENMKKWRKKTTKRHAELRYTSLTKHADSATNHYW